VIKKEEAITLLVRALGWPVEEASIPPEVRQASQVDAWAWPYLACALRNGLITERELAGFLGNQPAKRYEVAVWLARALDLEGDAEAVTGFADVPAIPSEAAALVGAAVREGILVGYPDRTFQPNKPIKRAEMATLLMRVLPWLPVRDFAVHWGTVAEVAYDTDKPTITLAERWWPRFPFIMKHEAKAFIWPPPRQKVTLPVAEDALVYVDGRRAELSDVALGSWAVVLVDPGGEAVLIAARGRPVLKAEGAVTGKLEAVTTVDGTTTLKVRLSGGRVADFQLADDAEVFVNGRAASVGDLESGMRLRLELSDEEVVEVRAWDVREEVEGVITAVYGNELSIETEDERELTFQLGEDVQVYVDDEAATVGDLREGDAVEVELVNGVVTEVRAVREGEPERERTRLELEGVLESYGAGLVRLRTENGEVKALRVGPGAGSYFGHGKGKGKAVLGQRVEVEVEGDTVVRIRSADWPRGAP